MLRTTSLSSPNLVDYTGFCPIFILKLFVLVEAFFSYHRKVPYLVLNGGPLPHSFPEMGSFTDQVHLNGKCIMWVMTGKMDAYFISSCC